MSEHSLNLYGSAILDYFNGDSRYSLIAVDELDRKTEVALDAGWNCEVVIRQDSGRYLARLTPVER